MVRYFREINLRGKRLARRRGVSHSQMYTVHNRNVGTDNAELFFTPPDALLAAWLRLLGQRG